MHSHKDKNAVSPPALVESARAPGPTEVSAEELHALLHSADKSAVMVIDVRPAEDYAKFRIPGSVNKPFQELNYTQLAAEASPHAAPEGPVLVFVSAQSPDVDDLAAREYMNEYAKAHSTPPKDGRVSVLLGGVCNWLERYPA